MHLKLQLAQRAVKSLPLLNTRSLLLPLQRPQLNLLLLPAKLRPFAPTSEAPSCLSRRLGH